jgi:hypothetical protein
MARIADILEAKRTDGPNKHVTLGPIVASEPLQYVLPMWPVRKKVVVTIARMQVASSQSSSLPIDRIGSLSKGEGLSRVREEALC